MEKPNLKRKQVSLSQYQDDRAKQKGPKFLKDFPKSVLLIYAVPLVIFISLILGYITYIRSISAH